MTLATLQESKAPVLNAIKPVGDHGLFRKGKQDQQLKKKKRKEKKGPSNVLKAATHGPTAERITSLTPPCMEQASANSYRVCPSGLAVGGPELREQHQTAWPSETGLDLYASSRLCNIYLVSPSQGVRRMNSGNFGKHRINLHALELALRSKWRRAGGRWSWEHPPKISVYPG